MLNGAVGSKEELSVIVLSELKEIGVKCRKEKKSKIVEDKSGKRIFRSHLHFLELADVFVANGNVVQIPKFVADACNRVLEQVETEGLFRKAGSTIRQREIRVSLESGLPLGKTHHVIDVANVIKYFFRELPEPLISYALQDTLLRCLHVRGELSVKAILLTCLLLPPLTLNTLAFFMQFLRTVAASVRHNRMSAENLAIIFMPALMPFTDINSQHFNNHVKVVQLLIEHANSIGIIPHNIIDKLQINDALAKINDGAETAQKRKKKRRSDMFNGLRKIVGSALGSSENLENTPENKLAAAHDLATCQMQQALTANVVTATDTATTPYIIKSTKKRKFTEPVCAFSAKKKRDLLALLPSNSGGILPNTPLTKTMKKSRLSLGGSRHNAKNAPSNGNIVVPSMERRWSIVGSGWPKRNKNATETKSQHQSFEGIQDVNEWKDSDNSNCNGNSNVNNNNNTSSSDINSYDTTPFQMKRPKVETNCSIMCDASFLGKTPDTALMAGYAKRRGDTELTLSSDTESVRISKTEYEAIKERVAAIETRISQEFNSVCTSLVHAENVTENQLSGPERVLSKYEQMIVDTEPLTSPGTEQLAQRLSRGLKIRRSIDQQIIRSPSARKIGTLRRRSQDKKRIVRNPTWHISSTSTSNNFVPPIVAQVKANANANAILSTPPTSFYAKPNLKRGRPNTIQSGLIQQQYTPIAENSWNFETSNREQHMDANEQWTDGEIFFTDAEHCRINSSQSSQRVVVSESASKPKFTAMKQIDFDASTPLKTNRIRIGHINDADIVCTPMLPPKSLPRKIGVSRTTPASSTAATKSSSITKVGLGHTLRGNGISTPLDEEGNGRASIARLRSQNAGQVMAKARLFDGMGGGKCGNSAAATATITTTTAAAGVAAKDGRMKLECERNVVGHSQSQTQTQPMMMTTMRSNYNASDKQWEKCKLQLPARRYGGGGGGGVNAHIAGAVSSTMKNCVSVQAEVHSNTITKTTPTTSSVLVKKKGTSTTTAGSSSSVISKSPAGSITKRRRQSIPSKLQSKYHHHQQHHHLLSTIMRDEALCETNSSRARVNRQLKTQFNEQHAKDSTAASPRIQKMQKNANYKFS